MPNTHQTAKSIFWKALDIESDSERRAFVSGACGGDAQLRDRVERLLVAHSRSDSVLDPPAIAATVEFSSPAERPGTQIGPYKLVEEIGEGGMGMVYMALQKEPVRRKVALKIIKPGMDTREVISRFKAEEQTLAIMDHPNIAKVLDAGSTESGRPYFVMELVNGVALTQYCDENSLTTRDRLELFVQVCHAVQHAHQKGIIHRDIKPSNILVTLHDGVPVPKIIDFGIAKAIGGGLMSETLATGFGQMIGTPLYMSPEQAERSGLDIDTRSDIYSLGVLLYELLTGSTPFDREQLKDAGLDEVRRLIREQEPPRPSTRISTMGMAATTVSEHRRTNPVELSNSLRHELDWIVMKALEKDRTRRYQTASEFARDIQRYLHDEAVEACPPSTVYRLRKFTRRHQTAAIATSAVSLALLLGAGIAAGQAVRATKAEKVAEEQVQIAQEQQRLAKQQAQLAQKQKKLAEEAAQRERDLRTEAEAARQQAEKVTDFLVEIFRSPDPKRDGRTITLAEVLDRSVQELKNKLADQPLVKAQLLNALGESYLGLGLDREAEQVFQESVKIRRCTLGSSHPDTLKSMNDLALAYNNTGRTQEAIELYEELRQLQRGTLGGDHVDVLTSMDNLACAFLDAGRTNDAVQLLQETLQHRLEKLGKDHPDTLRSRNHLAAAHREAGHLDVAIAEHEEVLGLMRDSLGADHTSTMEAVVNLAGDYLKASRAEKAIVLLEEVLPRMRDKLGADHPHTLTAMNNLACGYETAGRSQEAIELYEAALPLRRTKLGGDHPDTLSLMRNLAAAYRHAGRTAQEIQLLEEALPLMRGKLGVDHADTLKSMNLLGLAYQKAGRTEEAIRLHEETLRLRREKLGAEHPDSLTTMNNLAGCYQAANRPEEVVRLLEEGLPLMQRKLSSGDSISLTSLNNLGCAYWKVGRTNDAVRMYEEALRLRRAKAGTEHPDTLATMRNLAHAYDGTGRYEQAVQLYQELLTQQRQSQPDSLAVAGTLAALGYTFIHQGKFSESEDCVRESLQIHQQKMGDHWLTYDTKCLLGLSLAGQKKFEEAEPLLLSGYQGMKEREEKIPADAKVRITEARDALIQLYTDWGKPEEAEKWRQEREAKATTAEPAPAAEVPSEQPPADKGE